MKPKIVLASGSPQRRALLGGLGLEFEVEVPAVGEARDGDPRELVAVNAARKAEAVAARIEEDALVIAGDTEVVVDGDVLGQPADKAEARTHLERLSGRAHEVLGAVALRGPAGGGEAVSREGIEVSTVSFRRLEPALLDAYLASGEWRGRAGSYAIQGLGSALVEAVDGDLSNVIGLPIPLLARLAPELFQSA
jgi:septum formation protein